MSVQMSNWTRGALSRNLNTVKGLVRVTMYFTVRKLYMIWYTCFLDFWFSAGLWSDCPWIVMTVPTTEVIEVWGFLYIIKVVKLANDNCTLVLQRHCTVPRLQTVSSELYNSAQQPQNDWGGKSNQKSGTLDVMVKDWDVRLIFYIRNIKRMIQGCYLLNFIQILPFWNEKHIIYMIHVM